MNFIELTALDGSKRFVDGDKVLEIGITKEDYKPFKNINSGFDLENLQSDMEDYIRTEISSLRFNIKCFRHVNSRFEPSEEELQKADILEKRLQSLKEDRIRIQEGLAPVGEDDELKERWDELESLKRKIGGSKIECTFVSLKTDGVGSTYRVLVKESPQEVVKLLNDKGTTNSHLVKSAPKLRSSI